MSDGVHPGSPGDVSAGAMLRAAREACGLQTTDLAVSMKVPVKKLEALEGDRFDLLPDVVFVRALASSMCRALKIDPLPVLKKLPQNSLPRLTSVTQGINTPFRVPGESMNLLPVLLAKPAALVVLALLCGALILVFLPDLKKEEEKTASETTVLVPPPNVQPEVLTQPKTEPSSLPARPSVSVTLPEIPKALPSATPYDSAKPGSTTAAFSGSAASAAVNVGATKLIFFRAKDSSWLEVIDANKNVVLRRTVAAGESAEATGITPLSVIVGRADSVEVDVRGKPFSLENIAKNNVARFEVK